MARTLPALALAVLLPLGLAACGDEEVTSQTVESQTVSTGTPSSGATADPAGACASLVPDPALTTLGWTPADAATLDAGRCVRRVDGAGAVTVGTRALSDGDAATVLAQTCAELQSGGAYVAQPVPFLDPAREQSCMTGLADDTGTGVAELYFVNDADEVVQIRVEALKRVELDALRAGLQQLVSASADLTDPA